MLIHIITRIAVHSHTVISSPIESRLLLRIVIIQIYLSLCIDITFMIIKNILTTYLFYIILKSFNIQFITFLIADGKFNLLRKKEKCTNNLYVRMPPMKYF